MILAVMFANQVVARETHEQNLIPDLFNASVVLYQLRYPAKKVYGIYIFLPKWKYWYEMNWQQRVQYSSIWHFSA